jgi:hypothetical protein
LGIPTTPAPASFAIFHSLHPIPTCRSTIIFFCHSIPFPLSAVLEPRAVSLTDLIGGIHHGFFSPFPPRAAARGTSIFIA